MRHLEMFTGRVGVIQDIREFSNGNCVVNFSVAETPRIKKDDQWVDGPTIWTDVTVFGDEARNLHRSVKPGTFVTVVGERKAREYTTKDTNEKRVVQSVIASQVSISITKFHYVESIGNVNYAKEGTSVPVPAAGAPQHQNTPNTQSQAPTGDSFDDVFGNNDDDPFGLNGI